MKAILLLLLWLWAQESMAQASEGFMGEDSTQYLRIWVKSNLGKKVKIGIDYGQPVILLSNEDALKHQNGDNMLFNSLVDALNYLDRRGFEVVTARILSTGGGEYLMCRKKIL